jgi:histidine triad (HIT) family protein
MAHTARPETGHCTFCDIIRGAAEVSICHEDADSLAFMDIQPVNPGHALVVSREHYESLSDIPHDLALHLFDVTMRLAGAIRHVSGCNDLNIVVNSGRAAGQDEPHYHVHIIPRKRGDGFDIPLPFNGSSMPDRTLLDAAAARIIAVLRDPMSAEISGSAMPRKRGGAPERQRSVPVFSDTAASSPPVRTSWRGHEGAHGELINGGDHDESDAA